MYYLLYSDILKLKLAIVVIPHVQCVLVYNANGYFEGQRSEELLVSRIMRTLTSWPYLCDAISYLHLVHTKVSMLADRFQQSNYVQLGI